MKFKKCCLRLGKEIRAQTLRQQQKEEKYGKVRPVIHGDMQDLKLVAVGNEIHWSPAWRTFPDFLFDYIKRVIGTDWGNKEIEKPLEERHPIMQWYDGHCRFQASQKPGKDGIFRAIPNGVSAAYLMLAYDLYVLRHHAALQREVVKRLKNKDQFQGARYELFVAATLLRAGFDLTFEDETDTSRRHPEFIATHRRTGDRIAVEAKSRHRRGVLGYRGRREPDEVLRAGVRDLLMNAFGKVEGEPLLVFVDLNLPPYPGKAFEKPWFKELVALFEAQDEENSSSHPYNMIVFSNFPHHYGADDQPDPEREVLSVVSTNPRTPFNQNLLMEIDVAARQYGLVPNSFAE